MKNIDEYINEEKLKVFKSFKLTVDDLEKILYSLAFAAGWGYEVNNHNYNDYKKLWYNLLNDAKKSFDEDEIKDRFVDNWYDYELVQRGSGNCRHLD